MLGTSALGVLSLSAGCEELGSNGGDTPSVTTAAGSDTPAASTTPTERSNGNGGGTIEDDYAAHDHSGQHGAPAQLGAEAPVESITAETIETADVPFVNVTAYGVEGDGETDDTEAMRAAFDAATPHGILYVPQGLQVRTTETISPDMVTDRRFGQRNQFWFLCQGDLKPDPGIGHAIEFVDAHNPYVNVNVWGGGQDVETDSLIYATGGRGGLYEGVGFNYGGRLFHFEDVGTYSIGFVRTFDCGQSVAVFDASPMGEIRDIFDVSMTRGPEFHDSTDVCINQYENYQAEGTTQQGVLIEDCLSVFLDRLLVGGDAETPPVEFRDCDNMFVNAMHLGGFPELGGVFEDVRNSTFRIVCNVGSRGIRYTGDDSHGNRFIVNATNIDDRAVIVDESVSGGYHYFAGNVTDEAGLGFDVRTADAGIHLDHVNASGNDDGDLAVVEGNDVHLSNCRIDDIDGTPKTIDGLGTASGPEEHPDASEWTVGTRVVYEDTGDGSGDGMYVLVDDEQWVRHQVEYVGE